MEQRISPARVVRGTLRLPGDKSISHRYAMLAAIAQGRAAIHNYSSGADCQSTLSALESLGVAVERSHSRVIIDGRGLRGFNPPAGPLDAGNSGSTIRMLSGILAAQSFTSRIAGDESLSRRPMGRIMDPLSKMGARMRARDGRFPPLEIEGGPLRAIDYTLPVPSAQVKSAVLLAGLHAEGSTTVREPVPTRDHTEIALRQFGAAIERGPGIVTVCGERVLHAPAMALTVPGDLSSAAFFLVAALLVSHSQLRIENVGLNPTRAALVDYLISLGADLRVANLTQPAGELIGDLEIRGSTITGGVLAGATVAALIDEIPVLAVLGAKSRDGLEVRDAAELRVKETDRIATIAENLRRLGVDIVERPDGFRVPGGQTFHAARLDSFGDHRIAMAFAVAALAADGECVIDGAEAASVSFPEFYGTLHQVTAN